MKIHVLAVVTASALATAAPAMAETYNGPFVGVQAGWNEDDQSSTRTDVGRVDGSGKKDAAVVGFLAGYDYKVTPHIVIGAEAGMNFGIDDRFGGHTKETSYSINPKYSIDLTARAGYLVDDATLLYVRGGYTNARVRAWMTDGPVAHGGDENRDGWLVGGGVERAITSKVSARLEYRYSDLSEGHGNWDRHQVLLGAAYHF
jgi:outer membrane immunogenic protein